MSRRSRLTYGHGPGTIVDAVAARLLRRARRWDNKPPSVGARFVGMGMKIVLGSHDKWALLQSPRDQEADWGGKEKGGPCSF